MRFITDRNFLKVHNMLISFSGIDSSGKSTQIQMLEDFCHNNNIPFLKRWGKARGTPGVLILKDLVRKDKKMNEDQKATYRENLFNNTAKKKLLLTVSLIDLCWYFGIYYRWLGLFNRYVILDRYLWDTYIEIKTEFRGLDIDGMILWKFVKLVTPVPKVSLLFVIPPEVSIQRDFDKKDLTVDSLELKKEKINLYMKLINQDRWSNVLDGLRSRLDIHREVLLILNLEK